MDAGFHAGGFECVFQGQGIHDGGHHAHIVGRRTVHIVGLRGNAAEDVAAADDDADLYAEFDDFFYLADNLHDGFAVDTEGIIAHQGFAGQFQQDSFVFGLRGHAGFLSAGRTWINGAHYTRQTPAL